MPSTAGPTTVFDARFSSESAQATSWAEAEAALAAAKVYRLSTVRPDGSPHVTPVIAVWYEGALYFSTGPTERKAKNLERNAACVLTTSTSTWFTGPTPTPHLQRPWLRWTTSSEPAKRVWWGCRISMSRCSSSAYNCGRSTCSRLATTCSIGAWSAKSSRSAASTASG